jgi:hypothetical protein
MVRSPRFFMRAPRKLALFSSESERSPKCKPAALCYVVEFEIAMRLKSRYGGLVCGGRFLAKSNHGDLRELEKVKKQRETLYKRGTHTSSNPQ